MFAIPQATAMVMCNPNARALIKTHGAFVGFTPSVWLVTTLTAGGGLLIAAVVKHADNLLKTYVQLTEREHTHDCLNDAT